MKLPIVALLCVLLASSALAADHDNVVNVEINKGTLVKLDRMASSIAISDPNTADVQVVSPKTILIRGKKVGETSLYVIDGNDNVILDSIVHVNHNLSGLRRAVQQAVPEADVSFKTVDGGLVLEGFTNSASESENIRNIAASYIGAGDKLVNLVKTNGSDQIMLKVKFVEMARNNLKKLTSNLQGIKGVGNTSFHFYQGSEIAFHNPDPASTIPVLNYWSGNLYRTGTTDPNILLRQGNFAALIDALETQGLATTLAEPTLATTSGQNASFLAGGQYPLPVVQSSSGGAPTVTIQYQPYGVSLNFTPVVLAKDRISLTVAPEVSSLDFSNPISVSGVTYPILNDRKASAVVELGSGDSFMLAGLIESDGNTSVTKVPWLGDLPILGTLFRSTQFQNNKTELVIIVTPYVVHPVSAANKLQTPLDGYEPPSDLQLLMTGNLYRQHSPQDDAKAQEENSAQENKADASAKSEPSSENSAPTDDPKANDQKSEDQKHEDQKLEDQKHEDVQEVAPEPPKSVPEAPSPDTAAKPKTAPLLHGDGGFIME